MESQTEKLEKLRKAGIPVREDMIEESSQNIPVSPQDRLQMIQNIMRGAKKKEYNSLFRGEKSTGNEEGGLDFNKKNVVENSKTNQPNLERKKPVTPKLENFTPSGPNTKSIEKLFEFDETDYSGDSYDNDGFKQQPNMEETLLERLRKGQGLPQKNQISEEKNYSKDVFNSPELKSLIEQIAHEVSLRNYKSLLKEGSNNKNTFEIVEGKKNVIKIKGKLYKISPYNPT